MDISASVIRYTEKEYGSSYKDHSVEIYKLYVDMADKISARRQSSNSFFLSINTAIIALISYVQINDTFSSKFSHTIVSAAGVALCYLWFKIIISYRDLNSIKFNIIEEIENQLPLSPYTVEWTKINLGIGHKLYLPFTEIEMFIPWIFLSIHLIIILFSWFS